MAKHPSKTIRWKIRSVINWVYDKWMQWHGYKPYMFDMKRNRYTYVKQAELDEIATVGEKDEPEFEMFGYCNDPNTKPTWWRTNEQNKVAARESGHRYALNELRKGNKDARVIRRPLQGE